MRLRTVLSALLCLTLATTALGQRKKLQVGDPAPGLDIEQWVKGDEVSIEQGKVYLIEFWATWCGPCRATMPHLTELQEEWGDYGLTVIGISVGEEVDVVEPWVKKQGNKMDYTVAVDRRKSTDRAWLQAAGLEGIPQAFIIDREGKIAFIGNPHPKGDGSEMRRVLTKVMVGRYDPVMEQKAAPLLEAARRARQTKTYRIAFKQYDEVINLKPQVFPDIAYERFMMMLDDMEDPQAAYAYVRQMFLDGFYTDDATALRLLAKQLTTDHRIEDEDRDLDLALEAAEGAHKLSDGRTPDSYATLALVKFHRGEVQEAIKLQKRAWMLARPRAKPQLKRDLESYQSAASRSGLGR